MLLTNQMLDLILSVNLISYSWQAISVDLEQCLKCKADISVPFIAFILFKDCNFVLEYDGYVQ